MKICIIGNDYKQQFPLIDYGGIESCVENLAVGLKTYNSEVNFCVFVPKILTGKKEYGFKIIETNEIETSISGKPASFFIQEVKNIIKNSPNKPDIIWSQSHWSAIELQDLGIPIICTMHDSAINEGATNKFIFASNVYYRFVSKYLLENNFDINDPRQKNIYNNSFFIHTGLSEDNFIFYPKKENYVLWVAGLHWGKDHWGKEDAKGLSDFIKLSKMNPDINFICYGTGDNNIAQHLQELTKQIKNFHFLGKLNKGKEHNNVFGKAKFFMMLSRIPEAFGRTGLEAISKGTPVIGYNSGSIPEQISNRHAGKVFEVGNLAGISEEIHKEYDYQQCYNFSQNYHIKLEIENLLNKTREILQKQI